ncbi:hypothetical protein BSKO_11795 [Bryopsis sp. KO-2023]|nr:hypothetical protein BSKO_11795 [Bryopsis sp. KO-2023]
MSKRRSRENFHFRSSGCWVAISFIALGISSVLRGVFVHPEIVSTRPVEMVLHEVRPEYQPPPFDDFPENQLETLTDASVAPNEDGISVRPGNDVPHEWRSAEGPKSEVNVGGKEIVEVLPTVEPIADLGLEQWLRKSAVQGSTDLDELNPEETKKEEKTEGGKRNASQGNDEMGYNKSSIKKYNEDQSQARAEKPAEGFASPVDESDFVNFGQEENEEGGVVAGVNGARKSGGKMEEKRSGVEEIDPSDSEGGKAEKVEFSFQVPANRCNSLIPSQECCPNITFSEDHYRPSDGSNLLIGLGAIKSGIGFLFEVLSRHPNAKTPAVRHLQFFDHFKIGARKAYFAKWQGKEEDFMDDLLLEFSTSTLTSPWAPCYLRHWFPSAKFFVVLRNPVDRAISHIRRDRSFINDACRTSQWNLRSCCDFLPSLKEVNGQFIDSFKKAKASGCVFNDGIDSKTWPDCIFDYVTSEIAFRRMRSSDVRYVSRLTSFLTQGFYAAQLAWWFEFFPPSQFVFVNAEDLFEDPIKQANRVLDFANVDGKFGEDTEDSPLVLEKIKQPYTEEEDNFFEPNLDKFIEDLKAVYKAANQELDRFFSESGIPFRSFREDEIQKTNANAPRNFTKLLEGIVCI